MKTTKELQVKETSKMTTEEYINYCIKNEYMGLIDMYNNCLDLEGVYINSIYSYESLVEIMCDYARKREVGFSQMAIDLNDNTAFDLFLFDWSCWGNGCTPIETKEELAQILLEGSL